MNALTCRFAAPSPARGRGISSSLAIAAAILLSSALYAQDVFVPPVLKGVKGEGQGRRADRPIPFPEANEKWILARSKHFVFVSSAGERRTRDIAAGLETLAAALTRMSPHFIASPAETRVFIFSRHREAQPYFDLLIGRREAHVSGVFVSSTNSASMLMESGSGLAGDRTPFHELIHYLIHNSGATPPLWVEEGLADYFSNAELRSASIRAGEPIRSHLQVLQQRHLIPLEKLFTVARESDLYNVPEWQRSFYAESWALVDWLIRTDRSAFYDLLRDLEDGKTFEQAFRIRYKRPIEDLQRAFDVSFNRPMFAAAVPVPTADISVTTTSLDRAELLYRLGNFLSHVEDGGMNAERHFREALVVTPAHARALAALGQYDKAIAADPNDAEIYLDYAESLLGKHIGPLAQAEEPTADDKPQFRKARELAQKAVALGTEAGRAYGDLGTTYIVESEKDLAPGIAALEKARELLPGRLDYAVHLFTMYRRTSDRAKADALFTALDRARNPQVSFAMRATILRVELARANAFVHEQKLDEAAAIIRELAANTEDADARRDLAHQAEEIAQAADTNRQIDTYNKAVGEVNRGEYAKAMKTLDQLLAGASDPGVIRDARKLQKQLTARRKS
jgi:tetratricopeptide (TPR) repeat protein